MIAGTYSLYQWRAHLENPDGGLLRTIKAHRGCDDKEARRLAAWYRSLADQCQAAYDLRDDAPIMIFRAPGRVNLLGTHIDHQGGRVNPIAIKETVLVATPRPDERIRAMNADPSYVFDEATFDELLPEGPVSQENWSDWTAYNSQRFEEKGWAGRWTQYIKAAVAYFVNKHRNWGSLRGFDVLADGDIPKAAGLSSSSSLVVAASQLLLRFNNIPFDEARFIEDCGRAEWYVGTRGGAGDHAAITWGKQGHVSHIDMFPMQPRWSPMPAGYKIVVFHSRIEAAKSGNAQSAFNQRVATYEIAMAFIKRLCPDWAPKLQYLRDVNPDHLGVTETDIYQVLKALPSRATRDEILAVLPNDREALERWFTLHENPADGYHVRDVCLYGLAECARSCLLEDRLRAADIEGVGKLLNLSHDGDRVTMLDENGHRVDFDASVADKTIDGLINALASDNTDMQTTAHLWHQPGAYTASCPELDEMVDIARSVDGVTAAGLSGAGLGGCVLAMTEERALEAVIEAMHERYFTPRGLEPFAEVCIPVAGAGYLKLP